MSFLQKLICLSVEFKMRNHERFFVTDPNGG